MTINQLKEKWEQFHATVHDARMVPCDSDCSGSAFIEWLEKQPAEAGKTQLLIQTPDFLTPVFLPPGVQRKLAEKFGYCFGTVRGSAAAKLDALWAQRNNAPENEIVAIDAQMERLVIAELPPEIIVEALRASDAWEEHADFPRKAWQEAVGADETQLGYWDWLTHQLQEKQRESAFSHTDGDRVPK